MTSTESAVLQLMHVPKVGARTVGKLIAAAAETGTDLADVIAGGPSELSQYGLKGVGADALREAADRATILSEQLDDLGVRLLIQGHPDFPAHLADHAGKDCPPVLFVRGQIDVFRRPGAAFCGSRQASEAGLEITRMCAGQLARDGVNIISGYANGIDLAAHAAAFRAGGVTTLVLAEGILRFRPKPDIAEFLDDDNYVIVSQFPPGMAWTAGNAMQRNAVVVGLAGAVIVIESGLDGGTFAAGRMALDNRRPVFVVRYQEPPPSAAGNEVLIAQGAHPLQKDPRDGLPDLTTLRERLAHGHLRTSPFPSRPTIPSLFDGVA